MKPIKFETQQSAPTFYSKLHESCTSIRGVYLVDFKYKIPIIVDIEDDESEQSKHTTPGIIRWKIFLKFLIWKYLGQLQDISDKSNELGGFDWK